MKLDGMILGGQGILEHVKAVYILKQRARLVTAPPEDGGKKRSEGDAQYV